MEKAPIVVIGTGPGGAAAALSLLEAGAPVLLMEAGAEDAPLGITVRVRGVTVAKRRPALKKRTDFTATGDPRTILYEELAPGGLSNQWSCAVPRFSPDDFHDAKRAGEAYEWPLGYDELAPWYERVERTLTIAGSSAGVRHLPKGHVAQPWQLAAEWGDVALAATGSDRSITVMPYANGAATMATRSATAFNAYAQLLQPLLRAGRMSALFRARAVGLEWSAADARVVAVTYLDGATGELKRAPCRGVVVAAGAVRSAELLFRSRSPQHPGGIGNEHGLVGRYFHDHPLAKLIVEVERPVPIYPASYITRQALDRAEPLYAAAFMQWCGTPALARSVLAGKPGRSRSVGFSVFGTMIPTPDQRVEFHGDPSRPGADLRTSVDLHYVPEVYATLTQARDDLLAILGRAGWNPRVASWTVEPPGESVHYGGTCRMHRSPQYGVVDGYSRVHGASNVVLGDSSVFTTGPEKNPVLTAMALSARAADRLVRDTSAT